METFNEDIAREDAIYAKYNLKIYRGDTDCTVVGPLNGKMDSVILKNNLLQARRKWEQSR